MKRNLLIGWGLMLAMGITAQVRAVQFSTGTTGSTFAVRLPDPATLALLSLGLLVIVWLRRRKGK